MKDERDFAVGLLYLFAGGGFAVAAAGHDLGTVAQMGPGFFPFWLGLLLAGFGAIGIVRSLSPRATLRRLEPWDGRTLLWTAGSVALFAVALKPIGLVGAIVLLVGVASRASPDFRWRATLGNAFVLVALNVGIFVVGLGLPYPLWPDLGR